MRDLERRLAGGDPSAAGELALLQVRSTGQIDDDWLGRIVATQSPAAVAVREALWQAGAQRELHMAYGRLLAEGLLEDVRLRARLADLGPEETLRQIPDRLGVGQPIDSRAGDSFHVPDAFGRPAGMIVSVFYVAEDRVWSTFGFFQARREKRSQRSYWSDREERDSWLQVMAATGFDPNVHHPALFFLYNNGLGRPRDPLDTPRRVVTESVRRDELIDYGPYALGVLVDRAVFDIHERLQGVEQDLLQPVENAGVRLRGDPAQAYADAVRLVESMDAPNNPNYELARRALMAVRPPERPDLQAWLLPPDPRRYLQRPPQGADLRAWNAHGRGVFHQAMIGLGTAVAAQRGLVELHPMVPFTLESTPYQASYMLDVRSRRAQRTRYPLEVRVTFDVMAGHWGRLGTKWLGNRHPPDGTWEINATERTPKTTREYGPVITAWIREHFPGGQVFERW